MEILLNDIKYAQAEGILSFDPLTNRKCLIIPILSCVLADNPRASDLTSTYNHAGFVPCRFCLVNKNQMKMDEHTAQLRDLSGASFVRDTVLGRNQYSNLLTKEEKDIFLQVNGIKIERSSFEKVETLGFDVFRDFPVEILHTVLLVCILLFFKHNLTLNRGPLST